MNKQEKALAIFNDGYNCAQAVLLASDETYDKSILKSISAGFGAGMGRAQLTCGAVTGAIMVISLRYFDDNQKSQSKDKTYAKIREFLKKFEQKFSSTECIRLLGLDISSDEGRKYAKDNNLFDRKCNEYVKGACAILEDMGL